MDNITFGQYVPGNSWIYKLDPRIKIILTIAFIVLLFLIPDLMGMLIALLVFLAVFISTRISLLKVIKGLKPVLFLLFFTIALQLIYTTSETEAPLYVFDMSFGLFPLLIMIGLFLIYFLTKKFIKFKFSYLMIILFLCFLAMWNNPFEAWNWNFSINFTSFEFKVYLAGIEQAGFIFVRIVIMIGITSLLTLSTMTTDINNGIESVLSPLKLIHIPVGVFSMLISLTLRFIPTLLSETKKIMNAQASRGVDFSEGSLKDKVNQIISLLIPMFVISFKRAEDLANAMEARGYIIGAKRTKLDELKLRWRDYLSLVFTCAIFAFVIYANISGFRVPALWR